MKIADIETKIERGNCSEEAIELFKTALKRVPKVYRCQHCYTTAAAMPPRCYKQAIAMIQYGLDEHCGSWVDRMRSHHNMAIILESHGDYVGALKSYQDALSSIEPDKQCSYNPEYAAHMMRAEMHITDFKYSEDLFNYYSIAIQADSFSQAFQRKAFYRSIAEIIIFRKQGDLASAKRAFETANEMLHPNYIGPLTQLLKRKGFIETTGATKGAMAFLRRTARSF